MNDDSMPKPLASPGMKTFVVMSAIYDTKTVEELEDLKDMVARAGLQEHYVKRMFELRNAGH